MRTKNGTLLKKRKVSPRKIRLTGDCISKYVDERFLYRWDVDGNHLVVSLDGYKTDENDRITIITLGFDSRDCKYYGLDPYTDIEIEKGMKNLFDIGLDEMF